MQGYMPIKMFVAPKQTDSKSIFYNNKKECNDDNNNNKYCRQHKLVPAIDLL